MADYEDELICDLAEIYGIYNYYDFPPFFIATLLIGLRNDSRVKMKMAGVEYTTDQILLANIGDKLAWLCWTKTRDGLSNRNRPESIAERMLHGEKEKDSDKPTAFKDPKAFKEAWARINER